MNVPGPAAATIASNCASGMSPPEKPDGIDNPLMPPTQLASDALMALNRW